jgi:hypothetical protein
MNVENLEWRDDPVIEEIRTIRDAIHEETKGMSSEEIVAWYRAEAAEALREFRESKKS